MPLGRPVRVVASVSCLISVAGLAYGEWPENGRAIAAYQYAPSYLELCHDGTNGAIVGWIDGANEGVYAHHVLESGELDGAWPVGGLTVSSAPGPATLLAVVPDDRGGSWVAWTRHIEEQNSDVFVHHILPHGTLDPAWPASGFGLCTGSYYQFLAHMVPDGSGGFIAAWIDHRISGGIYLQRVLEGGVVDPSWPPSGLRLVAEWWDHPSGMSICSDGANGVLVAWHDSSTPNNDIYVQHVLSAGSIDPAWPVGGVRVCTAPARQMRPVIESDGLGGAVLAWLDARDGADVYDVYAARVLSIGRVDPAWPLNGLSLSGVADVGNVYWWGGIAPDQAGGAFVAWWDGRAGGDIHAHHVLADGVADPSWPEQGMPICDEPGTQNEVSVARDNVGGFYAVWNDAREAQAHVAIQHVSTDGHVEWPNDGLFVSSSGWQGMGRLATDGEGRALVAWVGAGAVRIQRFPQDEPATINHGSDGSTDLALFVSPSPSRGNVSIRYRLGDHQSGRLSIVDASGSIVGRFNLPAAPGFHAVVWTGRDHVGAPLPSGMYFARLETQSANATSRILLLR